jgi:hypothetical protein
MGKPTSTLGLLGWSSGVMIGQVLIREECACQTNGSLAPQGVITDIRGSCSSIVCNNGWHGFFELSFMQSPESLSLCIPQRHEQICADEAGGAPPVTGRWREIPVYRCVPGIERGGAAQGRFTPRWRKTASQEGIIGICCPGERSPKLGAATC